MDIHSDDWHESDPVLRQQIAESLTPEEVLGRILAMAAQGLIRPQIPTGSDASGVKLQDKDSMLTSEDADVVLQRLRVFVDHKARRLAQEKPKT